MDLRDYVLPPLDPWDEWIFYEQWELLADMGKATRLDNRGDGKPSGYREIYKGQWRNDVPISEFNDWSRQPENVLFIRDRLRDQGAEFFRELWLASPGWFRGYLDVAQKDPDVISDAMEPSAIAEALMTWQGTYQLLFSADPPAELMQRREERRPLPDFDPLRAAYGLQPEIDRMPSPRLEGFEPFVFQTRREVSRGPDGRFLKKGERQIVKIPTLEIPHASELGTVIRLIDADKTRKIPRGALARIETSPPKNGRPGSYAYIVPVIKGTWRGKKLDDPRHAAQRAESKKESVQLFDQRTEKPRKVEVLVTERSRYYKTAREIETLVSQAQKQRRPSK